jgi:hypothetical protein
MPTPGASSAGACRGRRTPGFVLDALEQALADRKPVSGDLVHHSDRGVQYVSIKYTERLAEAGLVPSVGSVGDSYDNALAETINGLYKAEVIHRRGPWRSLEAVEYATLEWVDQPEDCRRAFRGSRVPLRRPIDYNFAPRRRHSMDCSGTSPGAVWLGTKRLSEHGVLEIAAVAPRLPGRDGTRIALRALET